MGKRLCHREQRAERCSVDACDEDRAPWPFGDRKVQSGIVAQDGLLELIERRPWLDAELLDKCVARCLESFQCIGLPAAAV